jgi:cyclopropane fatty-acyl-phospholipid synthase-like methyltransferase
MMDPRLARLQERREPRPFRARQIRVNLPLFKVLHMTNSYQVTNFFYRKLGLPEPADPGQKRIILRNRVRKEPSLGDHIGLPLYYVPEQIHCVGERSHIGDLYSADMFAEIIESNGLNVKPGSKILDFGCSAGRLTRTLARFYAQAHCHGCDPRKESIEWADKAFPEATFFINPETPPISTVEADTFDFITAVSVWSHFSQERALAWFNEMRRLLAPGGVLLFTTHGFRSIEHFLEKQPEAAARTSQIRTEALEKEGYHFLPYPSESPQASDLDVKHFGMAFATYEWYEKKLSNDWTILDFQAGRLYTNQDVYVLKSKF